MSWLHALWRLSCTLLVWHHIYILQIGRYDFTDITSCIHYAVWRHAWIPTLRRLYALFLYDVIHAFSMCVVRRTLSQFHIKFALYVLEDLLVSFPCGGIRALYLYDVSICSTLYAGFLHFLEWDLTCTLNMWHLRKLWVHVYIILEWHHACTLFDVTYVQCNSTRALSFDVMHPLHLSNDLRVQDCVTSCVRSVTSCMH